MAFSMEIPDTKVIEKEVVQEIAPTQEKKELILDAAKQNAREALAVDLGSLADRRKYVDSIESFGMDVVTQSRKKNELLQVRIGELSKMGSQNGEVVTGLVELQQKMKELDPSALDFTREGVLGKIFNPIRNYFARFQKADDMIHDILESLEKGKNILKRDSTTLEIEQVAMRDLTMKLNQNIELGIRMDDALTEEIDNAKAANMEAEKIKFAEEEIQFPLRQKIMDFQQLLAVNQQGIVAMEILRRNNKELIRAVERAQNVTVSALRVAVTVASALYNQKIVMEKVEALNKTTSSMIAGTARMLKEQGAQIQQRSMEASLSVDDLRSAFADTFDAFDAINAYKQQALPQMKSVIDGLKTLTDSGEKKIRQMEEGNALMQ